MNTHTDRTADGDGEGMDQLKKEVTDVITSVDEAMLDAELMSVLSGSDSFTAPKAKHPQSTSAQIEPRVCILIVDDSSFTRYGLRKLLSENGYEVVEAAGGTQAIELYEAVRPAAVLLDITMPDLDGLTALRQMRQIDPQARVAMVTGMGQQAIVLQAIRDGASDFVVKPFEADRVLAAVQKLVAA